MSSLFIWAQEMPEYKFEVEEKSHGNSTITLLVFNKKRNAWFSPSTYPSRERAKEELENYKKILDERREEAQQSINHLSDTLEGLERLLDEGSEKIKPHKDIIEQTEQSLKNWSKIKVFEIKIR